MDKEKEKRQKRFQQKENYAKRQVRLAKDKLPNTFPLPENITKQPGRLSSVSWCTCGNSNCVMCGNPRKFFNELTLQEKKHLDVMDSYKD